MCHCIVGVAATLLGCKGSGGQGPMGKGSDNQHVVGGGMWQSAGVGGARHPSLPPSEMMFLVHCTSRSAVVVFFARMEVVRMVQGVLVGTETTITMGGIFTHPTTPGRWH